MGSRYFVIITIQDNRNTKYTLSYTEYFSEDPEVIFDAAFEEACSRYGTSVTSTAVVYFNFYKV